MICKRCGNYLEEDEIICHICGAMVSRSDEPRDTGVRALRQGRHSAAPTSLPDEARSEIPEYGDFENSPFPVEQERGVHRKPPKASGPVLETFASRPNTRRGVPVHGSSRTRPVVSRRGKAKGVSQHPVNWMMIGVICVGLAMLAGIGYLVYLNTSDAGQRMTARKRVLATNEALLTLASSADSARETARKEALKSLDDAPAQSYWVVGQEYLDEGDMDDSIIAFRIADILDPENYDGLMQLSTAYELNSMDNEAEAVYQSLIKTVNPSRTEAYTALITLYLDTGRDPEAADMMLLAYQSTDKDSFRQQRKDFIPNTPQVDTDHLAGRYELEQRITVTSPQGYEIYYTLDSAAVLPKGGQLVENNTVTIPEGTFVLRAVCVADDLVSDEMSMSYTVYYPSPPAPKCNLAPNTYTSLHTVGLRAGANTQTREQRSKKTKEQLAKEDQQTFYYTIDGSTPDPELSPVYDGTPIQLPSGGVTLRAIAVNGYGKQSSTLEVTYKFKAKPYLQAIYSDADTFDGFKLNSTSVEDFKAQFGQPKSAVTTQYLTLADEAQHLEYAWGYAVFILNENKWQMVRIEMNDKIAASPRGVGLGDSESDIVAAYKDMGMLPNQDGSRNLYYNDLNSGVVLQNDDDTRTVQYSCKTTDGKVWILQYLLNNDRCVKIIHYYKP
ncbi:MAG: chitobiase/beta-hexosaminidase C-terminal domain-containing protein [Eubacteriales bacterium]|nr:chitobiase/beta-hexosaminidase C-terminal domain-containing protein [Eubacteriales bacterium]